MTVTQEQLNEIIGRLGVAIGVTEKELILAADDVIETYVYLDPGAADERISTIAYQSATVHPTKKVVATHNWLGSSPNYYLASIVYTLADV